MIAQPAFDTLADELVAEGKLVSYATLRKALSERNRKADELRGTAASNRDLKDPFEDWRERRKYKGHLATLDLPEEMEKLIAGFASEAMRIGEAAARTRQEREPPKAPAAGLLEQVQRLVGELDGKLVSLNEENQRLREEISSLREAQACDEAEALRPAKDAGRPSLGGKKVKGIAASTALHFWDLVAREVARLLDERGPMTTDQLIEAFDDETKTLATAGFASLEDALANRLWDRTSRGKHRLSKVDGLYRLLPEPADVLVDYGVQMD